MELGQRGVFFIFLATLASADWFSEWHAENRYKCLSCEKGGDLMCYTNSTCPPGQTVCYYHYWSKINPGKSKWDADYMTYHRAWGCTESMESCASACANSPGCNTTKSACCPADTYLISYNYTDQNLLNYHYCMYGGDVSLRPNHFLLVVVFVATLLVGGAGG